ncbi:hypothetical protein NKG60_13310 [Mesorhizobium sp. M1428]|uniref:hypothetical protein n=1 Tax=unclassified Mesorhizobium TaxID=325217 RepID=UPI00333BCBE8
MCSLEQERSQEELPFNYVGVDDRPLAIMTFPTEEVAPGTLNSILEHSGRFHIEGLRADGLHVPKGVSLAEYVEA